MVLQLAPGPAGGSRYIVVERNGSKFRAVDHIGARNTRAPLTAVPEVASRGRRVFPGFLRRAASTLSRRQERFEAEFYVRVTDRGGGVHLFVNPDPTGAYVEVPRQRGGEGLELVTVEDAPFRFQIQLPWQLEPERIEVFSTRCCGRYNRGRPRPFPIDLSGLPRVRPVRPTPAQFLELPLLPPPPGPVAMTICVVGDGYTPGQQTQFLADCQGLAAAIGSLGLPGRIELKPVFRPSSDTGTDYAAGCNGPAAVTATTAYDSGYGKGGDCELLSGDPTNAWVDQASVGATRFIGLVNAASYGGSSWGTHMWVPARHPDMVKLVLHELGHMLGLRDEYDTPLANHLSSVQSYANVTTSPSAPWWGGSGKVYHNANAPSCPAQPGHLPPGQSGSGEVAAFQGAAYEPCANYRPTLNCKMRDLQAPFCDVCKRLMDMFVTALITTPP